MNSIIIVTGYMGSGSSAISDLLSEFTNFEGNNGDFEYIFLHCPDGLFDLEDKLLHGNNVIRSDEAICRFEDCMKTLYNTKNFWPGMYKDRVSKDFMNIVNSFIDNLTEFKYEDDVYWYFQQIPNSFEMQLRIFIKRVISFLSFKKINFKATLKYKGMRIAYPNSETFYAKARQLLDDFYRLLGIEKHNLILDQFLLPHNLYRLNNYFDSNTKVIVVERDPRDVYVLNKYIWMKNNCPVPYPVDVEKFCHYYKKMREAEVCYKDERILRIHFEDLVYNYDETLNLICSFLNLSDSEHLLKHKKFNPNVSINNTQVFKKIEKDYEEIKTIERELFEYLYKFPYETDSNIKRIF